MSEDEYARWLATGLMQTLQRKAQEAAINGRPVRQSIGSALMDDSMRDRLMLRTAKVLVTCDVHDQHVVATLRHEAAGLFPTGPGVSAPAIRRRRSKYVAWSIDCDLCHPLETRERRPRLPLGDDGAGRLYRLALAAAGEDRASTAVVRIGLDTAERYMRSAHR
jgi:hypothetical protein